MDLTNVDVKTLFDLGAGVAALALWYKQRDINKDIAEINKQQSAAVKDLAVLVKEHDVRISALEFKSDLRRRRGPGGGV